MFFKVLVRKGLKKMPANPLPPSCGCILPPLWCCSVQGGQDCLEVERKISLKVTPQFLKNFAICSEASIPRYVIPSLSDAGFKATENAPADTM